MRTRRLWCIALVIVAAFVTAAHASTLSGVIMYDGDESGPVRGGGIWHTSLDPAAAPMGVTVGVPPKSFLLPFLNDAAGEIAVALANGAPTFYQPGKNLFTLLFQTTGNQLSGLVTVNFFFNGDTVNPGISAVVPVWPGLGFTYFRRNTATTLVSLYMRDVDNHADLTYGDGQDNVSLTAVMVANRRQLGFVNRVSIGALRPDTLNDAVVIFELTAAPAVPPTSPAGPNTGGYLAPTVSEPLNAYVGEAEPGTLPEERGGTPGIMEPTESVLAPTLALPSGESTPAEAQLGTESTPAEATASAAAESDTPTPPSSVSGALRYRTPTPRSTSGASAAPSTPTGAAASEAATTATPARTPAAHKTPTPHRHTHHRTD